MSELTFIKTKYGNYVNSAQIIDVHIEARPTVGGEDGSVYSVVYSVVCTVPSPTLQTYKYVLAEFMNDEKAAADCLNFVIRTVGKNCIVFDGES